jgi:hypothetical protein
MGRITIHIPPSHGDPHNGRYDFAGEGRAVEHVCVDERRTAVTGRPKDLCPCSTRR